MKILSLSNAIKLMFVIGLVAMFSVIVQSCQGSKNGLDRYAVHSLRKLHQIEAPPIQPKTTFVTSDGQEMNLEDYRGKTVLVNIWATWCAPCLIEMPSLNKLAALRGGDKFEVVTISIDRKADDAIGYFEKHKLDNLTAWHDPSFGIAPRLKAQGVPLSVIYDQNGREIARVAGEADWASEAALALIDYLLEESP